MMTLRDLKYLIYTDHFRIGGDKRPSLIKSIFFNEGFSYCYWMRICKYLKGKKLLKLALYHFAKGILRHYKYKYGISIPFTTSIDVGFYIGHFGGIFINPKTKIGKNCNISQDVTLGVKNRGNNSGTPVIGDNVYIGPGVKIFGNIRIGDNVAIGANCVVTKDIPDNSVVVGIPGKVISYEGASGYVNNTNYKSFDDL